jgi:hypothetical protein
MEFVVVPAIAHVPIRVGVGIKTCKWRGKHTRSRSTLVRYCRESINTVSQVGYPSITVPYIFSVLASP